MNVKHYYIVMLGCVFVTFQVQELHDEMTMCVEDDEGYEIHAIVATPVEELPHANNIIFTTYPSIYRFKCINQGYSSLYN